jgi:RNA polymerase sigma-70 factor (ECF subfamily)
MPAEAAALPRDQPVPDAEPCGPRPARTARACKLYLVTQASEAIETVSGDARQSSENPADSTAPATVPGVKDTLDLVERAQAGDKAAFRELFRAHRADVARLAHRLLGSPTDLEDVVQDVFLQVHRSIRDFRRQSRFSTWLYRVTVNVVLMGRRAARSRPAFVESAETHVANRSDDRALPDEQVSRRLRVEAFRRLLDRLSEKKRTVYVLHELQGVPPMEIAEIVGAPVLTVRTRLFYARRELGQMLHEEPALAALAEERGQRGDGRKGSGNE